MTTTDTNTTATAVRIIESQAVCSSDGSDSDDTPPQSPSKEQSASSPQHPQQPQQSLSAWKAKMSTKATIARSPLRKAGSGNHLSFTKTEGKAANADNNHRPKSPSSNASISDDSEGLDGPSSPPPLPLTATAVPPESRFPTAMELDAFLHNFDFPDSQGSPDAADGALASMQQAMAQFEASKKASAQTEARLRKERDELRLIAAALREKLVSATATASTASSPCTDTSATAVISDTAPQEVDPDALEDHPRMQDVDTALQRAAKWRAVALSKASYLKGELVKLRKDLMDTKHLLHSTPSLTDTCEEALSAVHETHASAMKALAERHSAALEELKLQHAATCVEAERAHAKLLEEKEKSLDEQLKAQDEFHHRQLEALQQAHASSLEAIKKTNKSLGEQVAQQAATLAQEKATRTALETEIASVTARVREAAKEAQAERETMHMQQLKSLAEVLTTSLSTSWTVMLESLYPLGALGKGLEELLTSHSFAFQSSLVKLRTKSGDRDLAHHIEDILAAFQMRCEGIGENLAAEVKALEHNETADQESSGARRGTAEKSSSSSSLSSSSNEHQADAFQPQPSTKTDETDTTHLNVVDSTEHVQQEQVAGQPDEGSNSKGGEKDEKEEQDNEEADDCKDDKTHVEADNLQPPQEVASIDSPTTSTSTSAVSAPPTTANVSNEEHVCVCLSGFKPSADGFDIPAKERFSAMVTRLGGIVHSDINFTGNITHLIAPSACRTMKVLASILQGKWIVSTQWLLDSLEAGYFVDEKKYGSRFMNTALCNKAVAMSPGFLKGRQAKKDNAYSLVCEYGGGVMTDDFAKADYVLLSTAEAKRREETVKQHAALFSRFTGTMLSWQEFLAFIPPVDSLISTPPKPEAKPQRACLDQPASGPGVRKSPLHVPAALGKRPSNTDVSHDATSGDKNHPVKRSKSQERTQTPQPAQARQTTPPPQLPKCSGKAPSSPVHPQNEAVESLSKEKAGVATRPVTQDAQHESPCLLRSAPPSTATTPAAKKSLRLSTSAPGTPLRAAVAEGNGPRAHCKVHKRVVGCRDEPDNDHDHDDRDDDDADGEDDSDGNGNGNEDDDDEFTPHLFGTGTKPKVAMRHRHRSSRGSSSNSHGNRPLPRKRRKSRNTPSVTTTTTTSTSAVPSSASPKPAKL